MHPISKQCNYLFSTVFKNKYSKIANQINVYFVFDWGKKRERDGEEFIMSKLSNDYVMYVMITC